MTLSEVVQALEGVVGGLDPARTSGSDAARLVALFDRAERLCAAGKTLMLARAVECNEWSKTGARSAPEWLSQLSGVPTGTAQRTLDTAGHLADQSEVADALRSGELSPAQAAEISSAVAHNPDAAPRLLREARTRGFKGLKQSCRAARLAAKSAEEDQANYDRQRARRYCRIWSEADGSGRIDARMDSLSFVRFKACLAPFEDEQFNAYRKAGTREPTDRYRADALLALAETAAANRSDTGRGTDAAAPASPSPVLFAPSDARKAKVPAKLIVVVDRQALLRGYAEDGERCEIEGFGPVPVAVAKEIMSDAFLAAVIKDGIDIRRVVHLGRYPTEMQKTALQVRDPCCVIPGCEQTERLEAHHTPEFEKSRHTTLDELARTCSGAGGHHDQLSYQGALLTGEPGNWQYQPPPTGGPFDDPPDTPAGGPFDDPPDPGP